MVSLLTSPRIGLWLDTSSFTAEQTVQEIIRSQSSAVVDEALAS